MNEILRFMQKHDERTDARKAFYNLTTTAFGRRREITNFSKCNSFRVKTDLLNSENLKVALAQLCKELQVCSFAML